MAGRVAAASCQLMRGLYLVAVWMHVLAAMTWVGGMIVFVTAVMPYFRRQPDAAKAAFLDWFGPRFRVVSWACFGILVATGTFNLWARGVRLDDFVRAEWRSTGFGQLLLIKLALVTAAIGMSAAHERMHVRSARWVGRSLLVVGLAIVAVAVMMVRAL
jgi:uncharacterized membrane protein